MSCPACPFLFLYFSFPSCQRVLRHISTTPGRKFLDSRIRNETSLNVVGSESHLDFDVLNWCTDLGSSRAPIKLDFSPIVLFLLQLVPHYSDIATISVLQCNTSGLELAKASFELHVATGRKVRRLSLRFSQGVTRERAAHEYDLRVW